MKQLHPIVAAEGQTEFQILGGYVPGALIVTVNGIVIQPADFIAIDSRTVLLVAPLGEGDEVGVVIS